MKSNSEVLAELRKLLRYSKKLPSFSSHQSSSSARGLLISAIRDGARKTDPKEVNALRTALKSYTELVSRFYYIRDLNILNGLIYIFQF